LINEQSADVEKKNGVWTPNPDKTDKSPESPLVFPFKEAGLLCIHMKMRAGNLKRQSIEQRALEQSQAGKNL
jgi:hypothetical protein